MLGLLFSLQSIAQVIETTRDGFYDKVMIEEKEPAALPYVREADVFMAKRVWQVIDMREKMNQPLYFPITPTNSRRSLMQVLVDGIREGSITAYSVDNDEFTIPMTPEQLFSQLERTQTITMQRPEPPYLEFDTTFSIPFNPADVIRFRIKEEWFFDSKRSVLDVRVLGICPVRDNIDPLTGESRGDEPLFWVYYPDARKTLANSEVFNRHNDAQRMSYDDMFLRRFFSSYVYKESNVHDRRIQEYYSGLDALLESERVKEAIRNFEHDLWEY
ncbi:MAG: gliding motility protein GldN [Bacteroides sp.]|nr:gliding motility protein GldN [Bacteroides sp.]